jgi:hypothetical protein
MLSEENLDNFLSNHTCDKNVQILLSVFIQSSGVCVNGIEKRNVGVYKLEHEDLQSKRFYKQMVILIVLPFF